MPSLVLDSVPSPPPSLLHAQGSLLTSSEHQGTGVAYGRHGSPHLPRTCSQAALTASSSGSSPRGRWGRRGVAVQNGPLTLTPREKGGAAAPHLLSSAKGCPPQQSHPWCSGGDRSRGWNRNDHGSAPTVAERQKQPSPTCRQGRGRVRWERECHSATRRAHVDPRHMRVSLQVTASREPRFKSCRRPPSVWLCLCGRSSSGRAQSQRGAGVTLAGSGFQVPEPCTCMTVTSCDAVNAPDTLGHARWPGPVECVFHRCAYAHCPPCWSFLLPATTSASTWTQL